MYEELEKELKLHTKIMTSSFKKRNLEILQYSYKSWNENEDENADCSLYLEIASIGKKGVLQEEQMELSFSDENELYVQDEDDSEKIWLESSVEITVNVYDIEGEIVLSTNQILFNSHYEGYDTLVFNLELDSKMLLIAKSVKIFCKDVCL